MFTGGPGGIGGLARMKANVIAIVRVLALLKGDGVLEGAKVALTTTNT